MGRGHWTAKRYFYQKWLPENPYESLNMECGLHTKQSIRSHPSMELLLPLKGRTGGWKPARRILTGRVFPAGGANFRMPSIDRKCEIIRMAALGPGMINRKRRGTGMKSHHTIRIATRRDAVKLLEIYAPYVEKQPSRLNMKCRRYRNFRKESAMYWKNTPS